MRSTLRWLIVTLLTGMWGILSFSTAVGNDEPNESVAEKQQRYSHTAERWFLPLAERGWAHGIVVGVIDESGRQVWGFGRQADDRPGAPDGDSVFEIGSITKVFTGTLLADMAAREVLSVDDPVNKFLPDGARALRCGDREMRLVDLATHSSGLPRMPGNWKPHHGTDPYADYTAEQLQQYLDQFAEPTLTTTLGNLLGVKPTVKWEYSNLGVTVLGHLLARQAEMPYEEMVLERICQPLEMTSTRVHPDESMQARHISGHDADGTISRNWQFDCMASCGGLHSTVNDLLKFLSGQMGLTETPLRLAFDLSHQPHYKVNDRLEMGLNWFLLKSDIIYHSGMTGGYNSFIGFSKSKKIGMVVLSDTTIGGTSGLLDRVSLGFLKAIIDRQPGTPPTIRDAITVPAESLEKFVGRYSLIPLLATFTVTREDDRLYAQLTGQDRFRIYPESDSKFFYKVVDAQITFESDTSGAIVRLILHQNGADKPAPRNAVF